MAEHSKIGVHLTVNGKPREGIPSGGAPAMIDMIFEDGRKLAEENGWAWLQVCLYRFCLDKMRECESNAKIADLWYSRYRQLRDME